MPTVKFKWTEWFIGVWWWPAWPPHNFGIMIGPVSLTWIK